MTHYPLVRILADRVESADHRLRAEDAHGPFIVPIWLETQGNRPVIPSVDLEAALETVTDHWSPKVVGRVNDQYVKVAKLLGAFVWHRHDDEDELFQVLRGRLRIQFEDGTETVLGPGQFCVVPRGVMHNPVADEECWIVLIETVTTRHTGDVLTPLTRSVAEQLA